MKPIKLTQSSIAKVKDNILKKLDNLRLQDSKISFTYDFTEVLKEQLNTTIKRPIIYMTGNTYLKMLQYVLKCDVEIAWHGTVKRGTGDKSHVFYIKDVYLYPQKVAAATVKVDDDKYTQWSDKQDADAFNNRRFQGHSHVNMGTFYSGTDQDNKQAFMQDLLDDDYYIFLVTNKKQEHNFEIYDLTQNIIFENKDIDFKVYLSEKELLNHIDEEIKENCTKPTYNGYQPLSNHYTPTGSIWDDYYSHNQEQFKNKQVQPKKETKTKTIITAKVKRHVVIMNRNNRDFAKEYPEYEGEIIPIRFNGLDYDVFVPFIPFEDNDITKIRKDGWHVREMPIPEEYSF